MKVKRGELVAIVATTHDYLIGEGSKERTTVGLAYVTSVTREGVAKLVRRAEDPVTAMPHKLWTHERILTLPPELDAQAAVAAYCARRYPTAPDSSMVPPFASVEEAREALRPFLRSAAA